MIFLQCAIFDIEKSQEENRGGDKMRLKIELGDLEKHC